jgi:acyl-CoA synthetase (NDP forming)
MFLPALMGQGYHERHALYPVNPKMSEVQGLRCYPSVLDCPDPVDHVICQIPRVSVSELVDQCVEKGVRSIHFFTAGFSESRDDEMAAVEREIVLKARAGGVRLLGPNCMGLYSPADQLTFMPGFPREPGAVFMLSQSGSNAGDIVHGLAARGVRFSKGVSYGNGADLRAHDFLDYAAWDPETQIVVAYIEGVRDGRRFFAALRRCAEHKPTIVLKGGHTAAGARAADSHTASLAGSIEVFDAVCRQAGAMRAATMAELHDLVIALTTGLREVRGRGVALIGIGGGFAVLSSDAIAEAGLDVPPLPKAVQEQLREFLPVAGTSVRNPVDASLERGADRDRSHRAYAAIARSEPIDVMFTALGFGWGPSGGLGPGMGSMGGFRPSGGSDRDADDPALRAREQVDELAELQRETGVPFALIQRGQAGADQQLQLHAHARRLAAFPDVERASAAVACLLDWRARRAGLPELF